MIHVEIGIVFLMVSCLFALTCFVDWQLNGRLDQIGETLGNIERLLGELHAKQDPVFGEPEPEPMRRRRPLS